LGANWWAIVGTIVIFFGFGVHIIYATFLTLQNRKARGNIRYESSNNTITTWSSKNMFVLGLVITIFLILHLYQMWFQMQVKELFMIEGARHDSAQLVEEVFSNIWVVIFYIAGFIALWFHLTHGFWSALHTVGWNNKIWMKRIQMIGNVLSTIICAGFIIVAVLVHLGYSNLLA
jgi:succinate dehydrogenase / fumarate reductase cytochrome b subunit